MNETKIESQGSLRDLRKLKYFLLGASGILFLRYVLLIVSVIWTDFFVVQDIPVLFIVQIGITIIAYSIFCYGLMGIREYLATKRQKRVMKQVVWSLLTTVLLIFGVLVYWTIASFLPESPAFPYELWLESIFIAMPFTELIPLTIAMLFLSYSFWLLRKTEGWNTNALILPFFLFPLTIVRILAAIFKIINILEPTKYTFSWAMADYTRIIYAIIGILLFVELFFYCWRMKPKVILQKK